MSSECVCVCVVSQVRVVPTAQREQLSGVTASTDRPTSACGRQVRPPENSTVELLISLMIIITDKKITMHTTVPSNQTTSHQNNEFDSRLTFQ